MNEILSYISTHKAEIWNLVLAHKISALVLAFLTSSTGASLFARLLNAIPMDPVFTAIRVAAQGASRVGSTSVFRLLYQPFEDWFEKFVMGAAKAICEGLDLDSQVTVVKAEEAPPYVPVPK